MNKVTIIKILTGLYTYNHYRKKDRIGTVGKVQTSDGRLRYVMVRTEPHRLHHVVLMGNLNKFFKHPNLHPYKEVWPTEVGKCVNKVQLHAYKSLVGKSIDYPDCKWIQIEGDYLPIEDKF